MDAFEEIIATIFEMQGYWVLQNYRVEVTTEDRHELGNPSMTRPEIDILAYKPAENKLLWIECKSYLDSNGVRYKDVVGERGGRIRVFADAEYRHFLTDKIVSQLREKGLLVKDAPTVKYCLVGGNVHHLDQGDLEKYFVDDWEFYDPNWIKEQLEAMAKTDYSNNLAVIMSKLLYR